MRRGVAAGLAVVWLLLLVYAGGALLGWILFVGW
jgi:hypothetical protein